MITVFVLYTKENYDKIMWQATDITDIDQGPIINNNPFYAIYFVIFIFVGAIFLMRLFVVVMFFNFKEIQEKEKNRFGGLIFSKEQNFWKQLVKLILSASPEYESTIKSSDWWWRQKLQWLMLQ